MSFHPVGVVGIEWGASSRKGNVGLWRNSFGQCVGWWLE